MSKFINTGNLVQGIGSVVAGFLNPSDPSAFALAALVKMLVLYTIHGSPVLSKTAKCA